jgi:uroporphyrinogen-III synthase
VTPPIIAIRPEPGCSATVEAGRAAGLAVEGHPLFEVRPLAWDAPAVEAIDALLLGSANALRHGGAALDAFRGKPVHAVGEATAAAAEAAGSTVASVGGGDLQSLVYALGAPLRLLRVTGAEHVPLAVPTGIEVETRVAYESVPLALPESLAERLRDGGLVLLHSAAAARHFAAECDRREVPRSAIALGALAPRIADAAGEGWREVRSAAEPREAALLALARDMCHYPGRA